MADPLDRPPLVLASGSPRRHALLTEAGRSYAVRVSDVDETPTPGLSAEAVAEELGLRKAEAVVRALTAEGAAPATLVLGADTVVALGGAAGEPAGELLEKPEDAEDALRMLGRLSGSRHRVVTGVAVVRVGDGRRWVGHERTWVRMREITPDERRAYVASGEWAGKAGGYAIQETADAFVTGLEEGGFDNVVGLPVRLALALLARAEGSPLAPPGGQG